MNKARRHEIKMLKYKKRIRRFVSNLDVYIDRQGNHIRNPKTIDVIRDGGQTAYRTTSSPCSCFMCAGLQYNRAKQKRENLQYVKELIKYS